MARSTSVLLAFALFGAAVCGVMATFPSCPNSAPDTTGHYQFTASPQCYITTAASPNLATQAWTISMWVNPTAQTVTGFSPLIGQGGQSGCGGAGVACTNNLFIGYSFDSITTHYSLVFGAGFDQSVNPQQMHDYVSSVGNVDSDIGQWMLYVFEYNTAGIFYAWRNGVPLQLSNGGQLTASYGGAAGAIGIGAAGGIPLSNYFVGSIDEVRMWYGVNLPAVDVAALWCSNVANSVPDFYMNGGDFLSFGTAQSKSTPAPQLIADVSDQCYGFCGVSNSTVCMSSPCANAGVCTSVNSQSTTFTCVCGFGFAGTFCQTNINECAPAPCLHGGVCTDGVGSFTCNCAGTGGYTGNRCQTAAATGGATGVAPGTGSGTGATPAGSSGTSAAPAGALMSASTVGLCAVAGVYALLAL